MFWQYFLHNFHRSSLKQLEGFPPGILPAFQDFQDTLRSRKLKMFLIRKDPDPTANRICYIQHCISEFPHVYRFGYMHPLKEKYPTVAS